MKMKMVERLRGKEEKKLIKTTPSQGTIISY